jgi:hypothetical protein
MAIHPRRNYDVLSCGATVVSNVGDPDQDPCEMVKTLLKCGVRFTFYVMADSQNKRVIKNTSGFKLKKYITDNDLGPIIETAGRHAAPDQEKEFIKMYVWRPDYIGAGFIKWCKDNNIGPVRKMW